MVGWVTFNAEAAAVSEPSSATARNDRAWFQSNDIELQFMALDTTYFGMPNQRFSSVHIGIPYG
jgi:hypothetical protein